MASTLSERLRQAMAGPPPVTAAALARACKIKPPSVHAWLSGRTKTIEGANLLAASKALRVSPDWLATGRGPMLAGNDAAAPAASTAEPPPPSYLDPPQLQEAVGLLRQLDARQLGETINYMRWQVANKTTPTHGQALSVAG